MSLRTKLLLVALVTLSLPWAAWRFVLATEGFLRQGQEQTLLGSAALVARLIAPDFPAEQQPDGDRLYVHRLTGAIAVDGYVDDWGPWSDQAQDLEASGEVSASVLAGQAQGSLYLLIQVRDTDLQYPSPDGSYPGDLIELVLSGRRGFRRLRLETSAPGRVNAARAEDGQVDSTIRAEWQPSDEGYRVEVQAPMSLADTGVSLRVLDRGRDGAVKGQAMTADGPLPLLQRDLALTGLLERLRPEGTRVWLLNPEGWVLARSGHLDGVDEEFMPEGDSLGRWWRTLVYRRLLSPPLASAPPPDDEARRLDGMEVRAAAARESSAVWRPAATGLSVVASAAVPIIQGGEIRGMLVIEQASDALLLLTNQAISRLLLLTVVVMLASVLVLLLFASRISGRIRRLRDAVDQAMTRDGEVRADFSPSRKSDELGDLSRSFAALLTELRGYNEYLRSLASRLSHELNTPLAVVRSSLENLESITTLEAEADAYLDRAKSGTDRLRGILRAMGEARRLEESLTRAELESFDLARLVRQCCEGYSALGRRQIACRVTGDPALLHGSPELIAQMLDKLVDNADSFTPADGRIEVCLRDEGDGCRLDVINDGPPLPADLKGRLFESMVSVRSPSDARMHLGLGLHIVRLIIEFHRGQVEARDRDDGSGVRFSVWLPRHPPRRR